ncbi:MAG: right-handed parallel beta-helix repeat-containing protein [Lentisphaerae bacterium]|nr:right-handed parallel beta-helix repeat-containing protein [Lentisphaerota bacterium]
MPFAIPRWLAAVTVAGALAAGSVAEAATNRVRNTAQIKAALETLRPGDTLLIEPGSYSGNIRATALAGTAAAPICIRAADPQSPPIFQSGSRAFHFSRCSFLQLQNLRIVGMADSGVRIDDGGDENSPSHHIFIDDLSISETGPHGDHDALHLAGVNDFVVRHCQFEGWGGAAIDLVGCQRGVVEDCRLIGQDGSDQASGILIRAGSSNVLVQTCFMRWAGQHTISIGGVSDPAEFRPANAPYEATAITVAGNRILGSPAPIVWSGADGGYVHHNTVVFPHRWVARILQENPEPRLEHCHGGRFEHNLVLYDQRVFSIVNRDEDAVAESFAFRSNAWHRATGPRPLRLPGPDEDNLLQIDPQITVEGPRAFRVTSTDPRLASLGADAYTPAPALLSPP